MSPAKKHPKPIIIKISIPKEFAILLDKELDRIHKLLLQQPENVWAQSALKEFWGKLDTLLVPSKNIKREFENEFEDDDHTEETSVA